MPSKKYIELQEFALDELKNELAETQKQYQKLEFDHTLKGLENPLALKEVRRDVARMKTELRRREIAELNPEQLAGRSKKIARRKR
jgi:large subunit ribosomal protein L29